MTPNVKFYKIKFIKEFNERCDQERNLLINEMIENATDPTIVARRIRMLKHLAEYQAQMYNKIQSFETDDPNDFLSIPVHTRWRMKYPPEQVLIVHRGA